MKGKLLTGAAVAAASLLASSCTKQEAKPKTNVLFIFADDMTYDALRAFGNTETIAPNLNKIINSGTRFQNTYIMGGWNGAISIASRSQLISGRYIWNCHKDEDNKYKDEMQNKDMWSQVMKTAGYKTFQTGKWHMKWITSKKIFDKVVDVRGGMPKDTPEGYNRPLSRQDTTWQPWDITKGGYWTKDGRHWSAILAEDAVNYMKENKDSKEPLFMFCAFNAPHDPRQSPKKFVDMYPVDSIKVPSNFQPLHPYADAMGCGKNLRDARLAPFPRTKYSVQKNRQEYYALISHLDVQVGKIIQALKDNGMDKNTLIVFAGDNGLAIGHHGLIGKQSMYDHSVKVPLAFSSEFAPYLNIPKGESRDQLVYMQDLVPTVYDLLGIKKPEGMQFHSQIKTLMDKNAPENRDAVYSAYTDLQRQVRDDRYKLFFINKAKKAYLFDLKNDPMEVNDLFDDPKYEGVIKKLGAKYLELSKESGDTLDIRPLFPKVFNK